MTEHVALWMIATFTLTVLGLWAAAIAFGGPTAPPPMHSVDDPFRSVDFSDLPALRRYTARDGTALAYRHYRPRAGQSENRGTVVLIHGSSARSDSVHPLAQGLAKAGFGVYAIDVRGHGESGHKGRIAYVGQLEDDLEDLVQIVKPAAPRCLAGFSAGGGFALRFAASARQGLFESYVLMAPFLSQDASTYRPASGGWASVGLPRILGLVALNAVGVTAFNDLPVTAYALRPEAQQFLTPSYSFALAMNFRPHQDYRADMAAARRPMAVVVGQDDDQFIADRFAPEFTAAGRPVPVTIVPATGHIGLTLSKAGIQATVDAITRLGV